MSQSLPTATKRSTDETGDAMRKSFIQQQANSHHEQNVSLPVTINTREGNSDGLLADCQRKPQRWNNYLVAHPTLG